MSEGRMLERSRSVMNEERGGDDQGSFRVNLLPII